MKKLKNQLAAGLFSLIVLGGSCLPTVFANPRDSEEVSSNPITQFEKSSKPPRKPCEKRYQLANNLLKYYKNPIKYYNDLTSYDSRLVNWTPPRSTGRMPYNANEYIDDIESLTGARGYVRYILPKDSVSNKFKNIETEINYLKLNNSEFLDGAFLYKIHGDIYSLKGFKLADRLRSIVASMKIGDDILSFSREKCKSVDDYIGMFTSDTMPEFIPQKINELRTKIPGVLNVDLINIGRGLHRAFFKTMIYRLCKGEI